MCFNNANSISRQHTKQVSKVIINCKFQIAKWNLNNVGTYVISGITKITLLEKLQLFLQNICFYNWVEEKFWWENNFDKKCRTSSAIPMIYRQLNSKFTLFSFDLKRKRKIYDSDCWTRGWPEESLSLTRGGRFPAWGRSGRCSWCGGAWGPLGSGRPRTGWSARKDGPARSTGSSRACHLKKQQKTLSHSTMSDDATGSFIGLSRSCGFL